MACPKCNHEINAEHFPLGLIFCPYCGEKINEQEPFQIIPFCMNCGHRLLTEVTFCPECGKRVVPEPVLPPTPIESEPLTGCEPPQPELEELEPVAEVRVKPPQKPLLPDLKAGIGRLFSPVENFFSGRWRLKKLYQEWSTHDSLPREEIPADETLKEIAPVVAQPESKPVPAWMAAVMGAAVLVLFEAVGMMIKKPS
jgi:endogenous inhibitor of DNA gyrase (YacG/DUF329 family)